MKGMIVDSALPLMLSQSNLSHSSATLLENKDQNCTIRYNSNYLKQYIFKINGGPTDTSEEISIVFFKILVSVLLVRPPKV